MRQERLPRQSCCSSFRFFLGHTCKDVKRRKCHFCLAFCSVFVVVLTTVVINTIVTTGPIIFLRLAEGEEGEFDATVTPIDVTP